MIENTTMDPSDIFDEIECVTIEEARRKQGKRSSILKRPKNTDDDIPAEDLYTGRKSVGSKRRVSFADKFQVMEMNTGNIYDISGKSNSTLIKDSTQNEGLHSESKPDVSKEENCTSLSDISRKNTNIASSTEDSVRRSDDYDTSLPLLSRKHKIDFESDLEPERKKISSQIFSFHLESDTVFTRPNDELSKFKNYLFNTNEDFTSCSERNLDLTLHQNTDLNSDLLQPKVQEKFIKDQSNFIANNSSLSKLGKEIQGTDMLSQSRNVPWVQNSRFLSKDALEEFQHGDAFLPFKKEKEFNLTNELPNLYPISLSDVQLAENKENVYVDMKNQSILLTNVRQLKLKNKPLQISQDGKIPSMESQISNQKIHLTSEANPVESEDFILGPDKVQVSSSKEDKSNSDKTCMFNYSMDITCVSEMNISNNTEYSEEDTACKENFKLVEKSSLNHVNSLRNKSHVRSNKTLLDTSLFMDLTCNPHDITVMQDSPDSSLKDISASESIKLKFQPDEDAIPRHSFGNQCKNDKTVLDTSCFMDLTCNLQNVIIPDSSEKSVKNVSASETSLFMSKQIEDVTSKSCFRNQCKSDKTVFDTYSMDLTCNPQDLRKARSEVPESSMEDVSVSGSSKLVTQQNENVTFKNKTVFDTYSMDLTCNPQDLRKARSEVPESSMEDVSVSGSSKLVTQQNENVTFKNKTVFDTYSMDLTCNPQDLRKARSEVLESSMEDVSVSGSSKLVTQQNENVTFKNKTVFDTSHYMDLTCNPQDLRNMELDSPESSVKDVSTFESPKLTTQQNDILYKNDNTLFDSSHHIECSLQGLRNTLPAVPNLENVSASQSSRLTSHNGDGNFPITFTAKQNKDVIMDVRDTDENQKSVLDMLCHNKAQTPCVVAQEEKLTVDKSYTLHTSLQSTSVSSEMDLTGKSQHLFDGDCIDKENTSLHSDTSMPYQTKFKHNDFLNNQEIKTKFDFSGCIEVNHSVKDLTDDIPESHKNKLNPAFGSNSVRSPKGYNAENCNSFTVNQYEIKSTQKCISETDSCSKKKTFNKELETEICPSASSESLRTQTDEEMLDSSSLKNRNKQKLKEYIATNACKNLAFTEKNKNDDGENFDLSSKLFDSNANKNGTCSKNLVKNCDNILEPQNLLNAQTAEELNFSILSVQNSQKLGNYMFVNTDAGKNPVLCRKFDAEKGKNLDNYNPNSFISVTNRCHNAYGKELKEDADKIFSTQMNLFKGQADTEAGNSVVITKENSQKSENYVAVIEESARKPSSCSRKVENTTDDKFNCYKTNSCVSSDVPNSVLIVSEAKDDNFPGCKESIANDIKSEVDKFENSSRPNIAYAIKQLKDMRQCDNIFKFPEVSLSLRKRSIPHKPPFSCTSIQLSKAVRDYIRKSSSFVDSGVNLISDFKHDTLSQDKYAVIKSDKNLPKDSENLCESERRVHCNIPSSSQVVRSASKTIRKQLLITQCLSPKQTACTENTYISQTFKEPSAINQSLDDLDALRKCLNFENEATSNLPKIVVSSSPRKSTSDFVKNENIFPNDSVLYLENCSIDLVPNDDTLDSMIIKRNSRISLTDIESSKLNIPCEVLFQQSSDRIFLEDKEEFAPILENVVEKENKIERSMSVSLSNSNVINVEEVKSSNELRDVVQESLKDFANSSRLPAMQNDDKSQYSFVVEDKNIKTDTTKEKLDIEKQNAPEILDISKSKTAKESSKSAFLEKGNVYKSGECTIADVGMNKDLIKLQSKENNQHEFKQNSRNVRMEVDENPTLTIVSEKNVEEELILNASILSRSQIEMGCHDSFVEKQNNSVIKRKFLTEITITEKHMVINYEDEKETDTSKPSKLLKTKNNEEIYNTPIAVKQHPYLLQENIANNTKTSVVELNERPVNNDAVLEKNDKIYINESSVQNSIQLLKKQNDKDGHQLARMMPSANSTEDNHIIAQINIPESNCVALKPNAPVSSKKKSIDEQYKQNNPHKQKEDCYNVSMEVTEKGRFNKPCANSKNRECSSNLSKAQGDGKPLLVRNDRNLSTIKESGSKVTETNENLPVKKKTDKTVKENNTYVCSSNSHNSPLQLAKEYIYRECSKIQDVNTKNHSQVLDAVEVENNVFEDNYEKVNTLRKKLVEASKKEGCLWSLREMDHKQAVFEIMAESLFACYLIYVPLELDVKTSSKAKISFKHLKTDPNARDEMGLLLFKSYVNPEITLSPFSVDKFLESLSKIVDYALLAKSLIKDIWLVAIRNSISIDISQDTPKLTVKVWNTNHCSRFSLTFPINLKSYPQEKITPKIEHLDRNIIKSETILKALKEIQPGKNYLSNMAKAANAV